MRLTTCQNRSSASWIEPLHHRLPSPSEIGISTFSALEAQIDRGDREAESWAFQSGPGRAQRISSTAFLPPTRLLLKWSLSVSGQKTQRCCRIRVSRRQTAIAPLFSDPIGLCSNNFSAVLMTDLPSG